jgi:monoamine oxidase
MYALGGCYFCMPPVDSFYDNKRYLTTPVNGIYFAGTETAAVWMGYMEGALESAERTVAQLNELYIQ